MNKEYHKNEAKNFTELNSAYLHTEVKNGKSETVLCGDMQAVMWGIVGEINRVSEIANMTFMSTVEAIMFFRRTGYAEAMRMLGKTSETELPEIEGQDAEEEMRKTIRLEETKRANIEIAKLKIEKSNLEYQLAMTKVESEKRISALMKEKQLLTKECKALEARMKEMEKVVVKQNA